LLVKVKYYLRRINEASLISILSILKIKIKRKIYVYYYTPHWYSFILRPKSNHRKFKEADILAINFNKAYLKNKTIFKNKLFDQDVFTLIKNGKFPCLGYGIGDIPSGNGWNRDQFHNYDWKLDYFDKINFVAIDEYCDVKVPWEYSRLQFLIFLALDFIKKGSKDNSHVIKYENIVRDWIKSNPAGYGVNWICNMEVSIRVVNLAISYSFLKKYFSKEFIEIIEVSILEHHRFINEFPELSDVPGNHYLSNLMGSYVTNYFIYGKDSAKTYKALKCFTRESKIQFFPEGGHFEMAPVYHRLCLDFISIVLALGCNSVYKNKNIYKELLDVFKRGIDFNNSISSENILPVFGDNDSGHVIWLGNTDRDNEYLSQFYNIIKSGSYYGNENYQTFFLTSLSNLYPTKEKEIKVKVNKTFKNSGFLSSHIDSFVAVTRVGEQGLEGRASHDHDDALHTWLSFKGVDILVDTGSKPYSLDKIIRNNCIVSSAHNVLKVKSKERFMPSQGSIVKTIRGASVASNHSHRTFEEQCILVANLDIQENSDFDAVKRIIKTSKVNLKYLCEINDSWELIEEDKTEIYWRFPISKTPIILKDDRKSKKIIFNVNNFNVEIIFEASIDFNLEIFSFDFSSKYGSKNLCYGAHLVFNKSLKGQAFCKVYIDEV
jgi:hypothetical protein